MKLRDKTNTEICKENHLPFTVLSNVVEEKTTKDRMRATSALIAKALTATLGPYGSSTLIQVREGNHFATKDGYDLMNRLSFEDEISRTILDLFRTTAGNQVYAVGDGSTSAIVVANALFQTLTDPEQVEHFKKIAPKDIVDILNDIGDKLEGDIKAIAKPVSEDMHELDTIAAVATNNDEAAGKLIGEIYRKIGKYGFISMDVLEKKDKDEYEIKSGVEWSRGYVDNVFATGYKDGKVTYDEAPRVIISNSTITYDDLELVMVPLLKHAFNQENVKLIVIANDYDEDALTFFKNNRVKHLRIAAKDVPMDFVVVDIDQVTEESRNKIEDLALLCNCEIYDKMKTKKADVLANPGKFIGRASKVVCTPKKTEIIVDDLSPEHKKTVEKVVNDYKKDLAKLEKIEVPNQEEDTKIYHLRQRLSRLTNSSALYHVAGKTLAERMTRQRLVEDAVFACKSAVENGYVPGGNLVIPRLLLSKKDEYVKMLSEKYPYLETESTTGFFEYFIDMLADSFLESYRAVLNNSYLTEEETEQTIKACLAENTFYNLKKHGYEPWESTVVINSADTDIEILRSCISLIGILATSNQMMTLNMTSVYDQIKKD